MSLQRSRTRFDSHRGVPVPLRPLTTALSAARPLEVRTQSSQVSKRATDIMPPSAGCVSTTPQAFGPFSSRTYRRKLGDNTPSLCWTLIAGILST